MTAPALFFNRALALALNLAPVIQSKSKSKSKIKIKNRDTMKYQFTYDELIYPGCFELPTGRRYIIPLAFPDNGGHVPV